MLTRISIQHLIEKKVTSLDEFNDPTDTGMLKLTNQWLKETLARTSIESELEGNERDQIYSDIDMDYNSADIL